jgi:predicted nucleic acid-binding protein
MTLSNCRSEQPNAIVLDASVIINLLATEQARAIMGALPTPLMVTSQVVREIAKGASDGRPEFALLSDLISEGLLDVCELEGEALSMFFQFVAGAASETLGDGEAATLAFASTSGFAAAVDEKKATRLASERVPGLVLLTTVDLLADTLVEKKIGRDALAG